MKITKTTVYYCYSSFEVCTSYPLPSISFPWSWKKCVGVLTPLPPPPPPPRLRPLYVTFLYEITMQLPTAELSWYMIIRRLQPTLSVYDRSGNGWIPVTSHSYPFSGTHLCNKWPFPALQICAKTICMRMFNLKCLVLDEGNCIDNAAALRLFWILMILSLLFVVCGSCLFY